MPDSLQSALLVLFALFLVLLNGFFVAAEFSLVKVRATRIDELVSQKRFGAKKAQEAVRHLDAYLSATQLGITLASLGLGYIGEPAFAHLLEPLFGNFKPATQHAIAFAIAFTIITALHIVVGELAPKSLAIQRAEAVTLAIIYPLDWFYRLFKIPIRLMNGIATLLLKPFGLLPAAEHGHEAHSENELRMILTASHMGGEIRESELKMVNQVFDFAHRQAKEVMVPRPDVVFLSTDKSVVENLAITQEYGYTRYPLIENGSPDNIIGMIHVKDLLKKDVSRLAAPPPPGGEDADVLREIVRPILRVPETKAIEQMLRDFQHERQHMAIIVDEYGGTAGIVTLEDIVEEIIGDIQDEFDRTSPELEPAGKDCYHVDARMSLDKLQRTLSLSGPDEEPEVDTVGGWVLSTIGNAARVGDSVPFGDSTFTVTEMGGRRVRKVRVCIPETDTPPFTEAAAHAGGDGHSR